jgi:hypothetical protein
MAATQTPPSWSVPRSQSFASKPTLSWYVLIEVDSGITEELELWQMPLVKVVLTFERQKEKREKDNRSFMNGLYTHTELKQHCCCSLHNDSNSLVL